MTVLLLPGLIALVASLSVGGVHRRLRPSLAAPLLAVVSVASALAVVWSLALLAVGFLAHLAWATELPPWCRALGLAHRAVPPGAGVAALVALTAMPIALVRSLRRMRPAPAPVPEVDAELVVLPTAEPTAYALPGRPGHIVVSVGMLRALDHGERLVLLAHERAHLRHRHHRYVRVVEAAAAAVPAVRPLATRVRFATERWADESAAAELGDRGLVARAVAKAALVTASYPAPSLALGDFGVPARVEALLDDRPPSVLSGAALIAVTVAALVTAGTATAQLHHLVAFVVDLCLAR